MFKEKKNIVKMSQYLIIKKKHYSNEYLFNI